MDQNRGLIRSNNTENGAKIDDLSVKKAKNTHQPQNGCKTQENIKKRHFYDVFEKFPAKIQPISTTGHIKKNLASISFVLRNRLKKTSKSFPQIKFWLYFFTFYRK